MYIYILIYVYKYVLIYAYIHIGLRLLKVLQDCIARAEFVWAHLWKDKLLLNCKSRAEKAWRILNPTKPGMFI